MASAFSHAAAAAAIGTLWWRLRPPARFWLLGMAVAALPDLDVIGLSLGIPYGSLLGHRGLSHSLPFAAALALPLAWLCFRSDPSGLSRRHAFVFLFLATASHGVLDAATDGGLGVAFFSPLDATRYFFPVRPVLVSPLRPDAFFSARGLAILRSELLWIWAPALALAAIAIALQWRRPVPGDADRDREPAG